MNILLKVICEYEKIKSPLINQNFRLIFEDLKFKISEGYKQN